MHKDPNDDRIKHRLSGNLLPLRRIPGDHPGGEERGEEAGGGAGASGAGPARPSRPNGRHRPPTIELRDAGASVIATLRKCAFEG